MATLAAAQIYRVCLEAGFTPDQAVTWTAIALAESGGNSEAHNPSGEDSWGLWQINVDPDVRPNVWGDLTDPLSNARAAYEISHGGTDMRPWTVTHASNQGTNGDYRNFMDEAQAAAGGAYAGDFSGVSGYDDTSPGGVGGVPPGAAGGSSGPLTGADSDADGALDAFEMSSGTDPERPDSDADGLTDGFELLRGTDPLRVDSDADRLSDLRELRAGTDARLADSDADGMSDGLELAAGRDPLHGIALAERPGESAAVPDSDADGLSDAWEASLGTDPLRADSDEDGRSDALEQAAGTDPLRADSDSDGVVDGFETSEDSDTAGSLDAPGVADLGPPPNAAPVLAPAVTADPVLPLMGSASPAPASGTDDRTQQFLDAALAQTGDSYVFGAEAQAQDADPGVFDCSELTQWAAAQVGIDLPDGSWLQYLELEERGALVPVEQALHTPGALLFSFSSEPTAGGGRPAEAHVAISLGDGQTIEARGRNYGVGSWEVGDRFGYAAVLPDLPVASGGTAVPVAAMTAGLAMPQADTDSDGVTDAYEMSSGTDPRSPDTDGDGLTDGFELLHGSDGLTIDADGDGLSDAYEVRLGTAPSELDSDSDGLADALELAAGRHPHVGIPVTVSALDTAGVDTDGDGLSDAWEASLGTDPGSADSDGDGLTDALELAKQTDPNDPDTDDDGLTDGFDFHLER